MLKPTGSLRYLLSAIAGGPGSVTKNLLADSDDAGNHFDGPRVIPTSAQQNLKVWFQPVAVASSGNPAKVFPVTTVGVFGGVVTTLSVTVTNGSAAAGDTVTGYLFVEIPNKADQAL